MKTKILKSDKHDEDEDDNDEKTLQTCFCTGSLRVVHTELGRLKHTLFSMIELMILMRMTMKTSCFVGSSHLVT